MHLHLAFYFLRHVKTNKMQGTDTSVMFKSLPSISATSLKQPLIIGLMIIKAATGDFNKAQNQAMFLQTIFKPITFYLSVHKALV